MGLVAPDITLTFKSGSQPLPAESGMTWQSPVTGFEYMFVKFDDGTDNVAALKGGVAHWMTNKPGQIHPAASLTSAAEVVPTVTSDVSSALNVSGLMGAGIFVSVPADGEYCWIMTKGRALVKVTAATAIGDHLIGGTTDLTFGLVASGVAPTTRAYGHSEEAIAGTEAGKSFAVVDFTN